MSAWSEFSKGIWTQNPVLRLLLGLCPPLAVTTSAKDAVGMGLSAAFVLVMSNLVVSLLRRTIPDRVRLPAYIVIIACFVTIVDMVLKAYVTDLHKSLGLFIPLIVVNCIILGRAEAFASKNPPVLSMLDGLGMGLGNTLALLAVGTVREILGNGTFFGLPVLSSVMEPVLLFVLPPGAFLTLGFLIAGMNRLERRHAHG
ncbi:MAG: electron transport complex subunit E [Deltaproteobacteria bacterium]|nr:electron transport complex subunit E [Deltaproteobacteria bacterium]